MKFALIGAAASAAALSFALPAQAAQTLEVVSGNEWPRALTVSAFDPLGQSFTAFSDTITAFGFEFTTLNASAAAGTLTFDIYASETLTGSSLFSRTVQVPSSLDVRDERLWIDVALGDPLAVTQGNVYSLVIRGTTSRAALLTGPGYRPSTGQFFGGDAYEGGRLIGTGITYSNCIGASSNCDANFRVTGDFVSGAIPEPTTWALLILGFGVVGSALRRSRKTRTQFTFV